MKIINIVGARPNFMKVAPLHRALSQREGVQSMIVHTGQHYDAQMSDVFFAQLELPNPDHFLGLGGGSHTQQTAKIMLAFEEIMQTEKPDCVLVVGDVNSTIACALVAVKMGTPIAHVEAGLRSGDRTMPEEINRILTDSISDYLFVTETSGMVNLAKEGVADEKVFFTGNVMIDALVHYRQRAAQSDILSRLGTNAKGYILVTMHRPANVDSPEGLAAILEILEYAATQKQIVFPLHPRTRNNLKQHGLMSRLEAIPGILLTEPLGYIEFVCLMEHAAAILTDSGGIQEETTYLQVPCLTFRDSTERPVTVEWGTNILLNDLHPSTAIAQLAKVLKGEVKTGIIPPLWDGQAAHRVADILLAKLRK